ncbi:MAG: hypothetical protein AABZ78_00055 [Chloroflexota bacterium]
MTTLLKQIIKRLLPQALRRAIENYRAIFHRLDAQDRQLRNLTATLLTPRYPMLAMLPQFKDAINAHGFKCFSQNNEDGILLYVFSKIGATNRQFVEFGIQDGRQCNTANLSLNFGWHGLLMDADAEGIESARRFYADMIGAGARAIRFRQCFVTLENINTVLSESGMAGEIDLLSIDIDGNDYWVWKAITAISPRVVVIEYNASLGAEKSVTIPYNADFMPDENSLCRGASLQALTKLAHEKGYVLIGCEANGVNAFFVRRDVAQGKFAEISVTDAYFPHARLIMRGLSAEQQCELVKSLPFESV